MRSSVPSVVSTSQERISICMQALKDVSKVWLVARLVHTLFESILGNKALEERLQKASGKRHHKTKREAQTPKKPEPPKRKFDDMEINIPSGPPAPQMSYERSRPQTPAATPSLTPSQLPTTAPSQAASQTQRTPQESFLGAGPTAEGPRSNSPFNSSFPIPQTPPDLFLVTRNSPSISQSLWENFQPDQLFPDGTNMSFAGFSPTSPNAVDPQLQMAQLNSGMAPQPMGMPGQPHPPHPQQPQPQQQQQLPTRGSRGSHDSPSLMHNVSNMGGISPQQHLQAGMPMQNQQGWPVQHFDTGAPMDTSSQDDNWSNSSRGPVVPPTLNVEDWYVTISNQVPFVPVVNHYQPNNG